MPRRPAFRTGPRRAPFVARVMPRPGPRRVFALRGGIRREEGTVLFGGARRRRLAGALLAALALAAGATAVAYAAPAQDPQARPQQQEPPAQATPEPTPAPAFVDEEEDPPIRWRPSRAIGLPYAGRLRDGVQLPPQGRDFFTWDPIYKRSPNRGWRRWGTDHLVRTILQVLREHRAAFPEAPRVGIGDLSRPRGGEFGRRFGGLGHLSHQNGLDVDVYYPRFDGLERRPYTPELIDDELAQDLVDRFVRAGAQKVFVGWRVRVKGKRGVVVRLAHHDDHLHVRLRRPR